MWFPLLGGKVQSDLPGDDIVLRVFYDEDGDVDAGGQPRILLSHKVCIISYAPIIITALAKCQSQALLHKFKDLHDTRKAERALINGLKEIRPDHDSEDAFVDFAPQLGILLWRYIDANIRRIRRNLLIDLVVIRVVLCELDLVVRRGVLSLADLNAILGGRRAGVRGLPGICDGFHHVDGRSYFAGVAEKRKSLEQDGGSTKSAKDEGAYFPVKV